MGLSGLKSALPKGGQLMEDYHLKDANYFEGHIKMGWIDRRNHDSTLKDFSAVSNFVSSLMIKKLTVII